MLQILKAPQETKDFQLRTIFGLANEAQRKGAYTLSNEAVGYLLFLALDDDTDGKRSELTIDIETVDPMGKQRHVTKYDRVRITYRGCTTRIPMRCLVEETQGNCYRRVGGDYLLRQRPRHGYPEPRISDEEFRRLEAKFRLHMTNDTRCSGRAMLRST